MLSDDNFKSGNHLLLLSLEAIVDVLSSGLIISKVVVGDDSKHIIL